MVSPDFWKNRRVFLTGHTGFKGSWTVAWLRHMGAEVYGYSLDIPTEPALFLLSGLDRKVRADVRADIRDGEAFASHLQASEAEIVLHMAAQPLVRESYRRPVDTYATNVMGTVNLLEAVRCTPSVRVVINVTTDKVYENREWDWGYRENEALGGFDPYSSSKACSELVTTAYRNSFFPIHEYERHGVAIATVRAGNVIGGGDWAADRLVPDIVRALQRQEKVIIRRPTAIRPWQHVLEPVSGYLELAEGLYAGRKDLMGAFNFGPEDQDARPVEWIVRKMCRLWNARWQTGADYEVVEDAAYHEASHLKLDISRARRLLGYVPRWDLETALDKVVAWVAAEKEQGAEAAMVTQILDFENDGKIEGSGE